jgi:alcohol dehydrogenase YqhD (iron-dependent ADH family)
MENFTYYNPTSIIFGKKTENEVGKEVKKYGSRVLLHHYGHEYATKSGLLSRITDSLKKENLDVFELAGVKPNPRLNDVRAGIEFARSRNIDFILALGGGSVIDSAKAIGIGSLYKGDVWDFFEGKAEIRKSLPVGVILTLPGAGSESSASAVITREEGLYKRSIDGIDLVRPKFAILNPELTYTLPAYQTASGACDIISHALERYLSVTQFVDLTDKLCEAVVKTVIKNLPLALQNPTDYNARAEIMWAGSISHNDLLGTGRVPAWECHKIEHELSGMYDVAHGAGLTALTPSFMRFVYKERLSMFVKFATRIWNLENDFDCPERLAAAGIDEMERFFRSVGMPIRLSELKIQPDRFEELAAKCTEKGPVGWFRPLNKEDVLRVLEMAM